MGRYDYHSNVKEALKDLINDEFADRLSDYDSLEEFREALEQSAWLSDGVTGNASGSHTFSAWKAEECLLHNTDLLREALECFGDGTRIDIEKGAEHYDVVVRCFVLGEVLDEAIEECGIDEDSFSDKEDEEVAERECQKKS